MKVNVGSVDRALRIIIGIGLLSLLFLLEGPARWWGLIGIVPLLTGALRYCPLYGILGMSTCPLEKKGA
jgi:Inner membrane protein YgaP-like, transmembrane domain